LSFMYVELDPINEFYTNKSGILEIVQTNKVFFVNNNKFFNRYTLFDCLIVLFIS
jgi:hypothetical protein